MKAWPLLLLALVAPAQAGVVASEPFSEDAAFAPVGQQMPDEITVVSGAMDVTVRDDGLMVVLLGTTGRIGGVDQVCWGSNLRRDCGTDGPYSLNAAPGSAIALRMPGDSGASAKAGHAFATFLQPDEFEGLDVGPAMGASTVNGTAQLFPAPIPEFQPSFSTTFESILDEVGMMAILAGTVDIFGPDGSIVHTSTTDNPLIGFTGAVTSTPWPAEGMLLGFRNGNATFTQPTADDVRSGFDLARIESIVTAAQTGTYAPPQECVDCPQEEVFGFTTEELEGVLGEILGAALVRVPTNEASPAAIFSSLLVRYESLSAVSNGTMVTLSGEAPLVVNNGEVQGAEQTHGVSYFQLPWWSWMLWAIAIASMVAVAIKKPEKSHAIDKWGLIGVGAGFVALIIVFLLWDAQFARVFGTSMLQTGGNGAAPVVVLAVQLAVFGYVYGAAIVPLHIALRRGIRLAGYGKGARLGFPVAVLVGYFLGAHLLLSYIEILLAQAS